MRETFKALATAFVGFGLDFIATRFSPVGTELSSGRQSEGAPGETTSIPQSGGPIVTPCGVAKTTIGGRDIFFDSTGRQISKEEFEQAVRDCGNKKRAF